MDSPWVPGWRCLRCGALRGAGGSGPCGCGGERFARVLVRRAELSDWHNPDETFTATDLHDARRSGRLSGFMIGAGLGVVACVGALALSLFLSGVFNGGH